MASSTRWTWVWVSFGSWWWAGKPGVLQSMGLQRVGCDWVTELNWKPNLHQKKKKKVMVTVWWSEPVWFAAAFWIPVKPLHLRSMLSKSLRCTENCNARHWHFVNKKEPNSPRQCLSTCRTTNTSKVEWIGLQSFALSNIFTWFLGNTLPLLQASWQCFAGKMLPQPTGGRKCFPRVPRTTDFYATGINKLIGKKCVVGNGVYFDY